jgi:hypothetical protein
MDIYTKRGTLSAYGLGCGYVEHRERNGISVELWREHGVYHVRTHDYSAGRIHWSGSSLLGTARETFAIEWMRIRTGHYIPGDTTRSVTGNIAA